MPLRSILVLLVDCAVHCRVRSGSSEAFTFPTADLPLRVGGRDPVARNPAADVATVVWEVQQDDEREAHSPTNPRPQDDQERLKSDTWRDLRRELDDQAYTSFPGELRWLGLGLATLFIVGCVLPLLLLGSPSNAEQIGFVIPVSALVLTIGGYMDRRASNEFRKWKTTTHYSIVDAEYEQQQINQEQWAGEDARRETRDRKADGRGLIASRPSGRPRVDR